MEILQWVKKQTGKLADNVKDYKFYVKNEPNFIDSSTTLILTPFTNRDEIGTVPCIYKWSRIKNGLLTEVTQFKGNSFICQPSDIGCVIQAQVTSTDNGHPGTAILKYGPVKLDVIIKKQIQHALTSGNAVLNVDLIQKDEVKQCQIKITQENIRISHCHSNNQYSFEYTLGQPRIESSIKQPNKAYIYFNEKYEDQVVKFISSIFGFHDPESIIKQSNQKRIQLKFTTRALKDNFLLIVKAFNTKKAMKTSAIISKLENVELSNNENFNYMLQIESLRADLVKLVRLNDKYLNEKRIYYQESRKLEKQIEEIIVTYTKIVEGRCKNQSELDQSVMELRQKRDEVMERKLHSLIRENEVLKDKIEFINQQIVTKQGGILIGSSSDQLSPSRGGFIKKRGVQQAPVQPFQSILENPYYQSDAKSSVDQEKILLAKKLNESVIKISRLQQKVRQLKQNQSALILDSSQLSNISSQSRKQNMTAFELGSGEKEKFCNQIEELKRKNMKLKEENEKIKSELGNENKSNYSKNLNILDEDLKSQKLKHSNSHKSPETGKSTPENELLKKIEILKLENERLRQEIERINIQKQIILKEKSAVEEKLKRKISDLSKENDMYKRNQDALNRSQNLSMEMQAYNQEQTAWLKEQNQMLTNENLKINGMYKKAIDELKQMNKLKQQNLKMTATINQLSIKVSRDASQII